MIDTRIVFWGFESLQLSWIQIYPSFLSSKCPSAKFRPLSECPLRSKKRSADTMTKDSTSSATVHWAPTQWMICTTHSFLLIPSLDTIIIIDNYYCVTDIIDTIDSIVNN